jgi:hypothetical protein
MQPMIYSIAANSLLIFHFLFMGFVVLGNFVNVINLLIYGQLDPRRL